MMELPGCGNIDGLFVIGNTLSDVRVQGFICLRPVYFCLFSMEIIGWKGRIYSRKDKYRPGQSPNLNQPTVVVKGWARWPSGLKAHVYSACHPLGSNPNHDPSPQSTQSCEGDFNQQVVLIYRLR